MSATLLYIFHCNQVSGLFLVESLVILTYLFSVKYSSDICAEEELYYAYETQISGEYSR